MSNQDFSTNNFSNTYVRMYVHVLYENWNYFLFGFLKTCPKTKLFDTRSVPGCRRKLDLSGFWTFTFVQSASEIRTCLDFGQTNGSIVKTFGFQTAPKTERPS